jgi:DnaJ-class molecular chaperone
MATCPRCNGSGKCQVCKGYGKGGAIVTYECKACDPPGSGNCSRCRGKGTV